MEKVVDAEPTVLEAGDYWIIFGGIIFQNQMRKAKLGQIIGVRFESEKPPTRAGYNPTKVINVYLGEMDPDYQGESSGDIPM